MEFYRTKLLYLCLRSLFSVPKWLQKSACLNNLDPSITVTFHPEKSMIKAGKVCPNTDVKYIECHDPVSKYIYILK